jgi:FKBP-type peptidyl-prolyl cis-trans isomerase SlpA
MSARHGDTLRLRYSLSLPDGTLADSTFDTEPETLTLGAGVLSSGLEQCLLGMPAGERRAFELEPWQAFGEPDPDMIQRIPRADLPEDFPLEPDTLVEFALPSGVTLPGLILEIGADAVRVDFNHPLAGCRIRFEAEIVEILRT